MSTIVINSIMKNPSLGDGPGYRTVLFLQGCNIFCNKCQNVETWDITCGNSIEIKELAELLRKKCFNKKLTISGGEPLMQIKELKELLELIKDFDICLYTGYELEEVPSEILKYLKYIKVGPFIWKERTTTMPFVGSKNQKFLEVNNEKSESE
ncbi:anaerobic ribonucleoside-triphosphate reductase activating protein [Spiroplasma helicoides]|uniref:Anaerobic ribonucleoside-triphosphate reductase-activating protein n=1 Tax=Spiroplasma helicoides TaxID=216938 RepID=A0A1B3SLT8_9MOLU|nr:4Fe-4S single cluster domain-containing protein [Spiroplasma helicoides]AOG60870.1 anaerobic ribonucleoside-triphosphate reductase activating protein [Spiroplasma helicoides]